MTILIPNDDKREGRDNKDLDKTIDSNSQESNKNSDGDLQEFLRMPIPELEESKRKAKEKQKRELFNNVCFCIFLCILIFFSLRGCHHDPGYYDEAAEEYRYGR